eukprot:UN01047
MKPLNFSGCKYANFTLSLIVTWHFVQLFFQLNHLFILNFNRRTSILDYFFSCCRSNIKLYCC